MYKAKMLYDGNINELKIAIDDINKDHGIIISTSSTKYYTYIFYDVPEMS